MRGTDAHVLAIARMNESDRARQTRLRRRFDRAAACYDQFAGVQREITLRLLERLDLVQVDPGCVVDLGAGTGDGATQLGQRYPRAQIIAVDFSHAMLKQGQKGGSAGTPVVADAFQLPFAPGTVDLVFSSSTLQWCLPLAEVLQEISRVLHPGGLLMFSTYGPDTLHELQAAQRAAGVEGGVNEFIDMHPIGDLLLEEGYQDPVLDVERLDASYASVRDLVRELKGIGSSRIESPVAQPCTRNQWQALDEAYPVDDQGRVHATYEAIFGHALAPVSRTRGETATVPVSAIGRGSGR